MKLNKLLSIYACSLLIMSVPAVFAQTPPSAGELLKRIEEQNQQELPNESHFTVAPLPAEIKPIKGLSISLKRIFFKGNTLVSDTDLELATSEYINREINFTDLQKAAAAVATVYRERGWLSRVYIPKQEISNAGVWLQVVEAHFGKVKVNELALDSIEEADLKPWIIAAQFPKNPVLFKQIDRAVLLLNDLPGIRVTGNLTKGSEENATDLLLSLRQANFFQGNVSGSNEGSRSTGVYRLNTQAAMNSLVRFGDQMTALVSLTEGSFYGRGSYTFPLGHSGLRVSASGSYMQYEIIQSLKALDVKGSSATYQLAVRYPLIREQSNNLYLSSSLNFKSFENKAAGRTTSHYDVSSVNIQLSGNQFDGFWGSGSSQAMFGLHAGYVDLTGSANKAVDTLTTQTHGGYIMFNGSVARQQTIIENLSLFLKLSGQFSSKNLDSSERLSLGGPTTVRAYPVGEASGSEGALFQVELQKRLTRYLTLAAFYDRGNLQVNKDNDFPGAPTLNNYYLEGAGVYLNWFGPYGFHVKATYAHRIGENPNPNLNGSDRDGSMKKHRFWASVSWSF